VRRGGTSQRAHPTRRVTLALSPLRPVGNMLSRAQLVAALVLVGVLGASGFYLPGVAPRKYVHGEQLMVKVNTLTSDLTPLQVQEPCH
jgi:hypothetical protein